MKVQAIFSAILVMLANPQLKTSADTYSSEVDRGPSFDRDDRSAELRPEDFVGPKVRTWTAKEIFDTIRYNPSHELMPYIREAATQILLTVFTDQNWVSVLAAVPSPSGKKNWKLEELEMYQFVPEIDEEFRAALDHSHQLFIDLRRTHPEANLRAIPVVIAALDISTWNLLAIKYALKEEISPTLKIALESMLEDMTARGASEEEEVSLVTTVGIIANNPEYYELTIPPNVMTVLEEDAYLENTISEEEPEPATSHEEFSWEKTEGTDVSAWSSFERANSKEDTDFDEKISKKKVHTTATPPKHKRHPKRKPHRRDKKNKVKKDYKQYPISERADDQNGSTKHKREKKRA